MAVSSADIGCVVNLDKMASAVVGDGMTPSGPRRSNCLAVLRHPPSIFCDNFGVVIGEVGWPSACVGYGTYVVKVLGKKCFPFAMVRGLYSTLKMCNSEFGCARGS